MTSQESANNFISLNMWDALVRTDSMFSEILLLGVGEV